MRPIAHRKDYIPREDAGTIISLLFCLSFSWRGKNPYVYKKSFMTFAGKELMRGEVQFENSVVRAPGTTKKVAGQPKILMWSSDGQPSWNFHAPAVKFDPIYLVPSIESYYYNIVHLWLKSNGIRRKFSIG